MTGKLNDRLALILTALACSGLFVLFFVFIQPRFSEGWANFIFWSVGYLVILFYNGYTFRAFKLLPKWKILLFQAIYYALTTGIAFLLFRYGMVHLPERGLVYVFPIAALTGLSLFILHHLTERLKFFKSNRGIRRKSHRT